MHINLLLPRHIKKPSVPNQGLRAVACERYVRIKPAMHKYLQRALGEYLTEPKAQVWFEMGEMPDQLQSVRLDRRSKMMYDDHHVFLNGESWRAAGQDAALMHHLADSRELTRAQLAKASPEALGLLMEWCDDGWLHPGA